MTKQRRPPRGWNEKKYEHKTHWPNKAGTGVHCGKLSSFYEPLKVARERSLVTCETCKGAL